MYVYTFRLIIPPRDNRPPSSQSGWLLPSGHPHGNGAV